MGTVISWLQFFVFEIYNPNGVKILKEFEDIIRRCIRDKDVAVELIMAGVNRNFRCHSKESDFFARFSPSELHTAKQIQFEASVLKRANELGLPVCRAYRTFGNSIFGPFDIDGVSYHVFLNETINGDHLACQKADVELFAKALAQLHKMPIDGLNVPEDVRPSIRNHLSNSRFRTVFDKLNAAQQSLPSPSPDLETLLHGDAWIGNALKHNNQVTLFDFEYTRIGAVEYDIATFLWALKSEKNFSFEEIFSCFCTGYRTICDRSFDSDLINRYMLERELRNLYFMERFIRLTPEIAKQAEIFAQETIQFVEENQISAFLQA